MAALPRNTPAGTRAPEGVPDSRGLNLFHADPSFRGLLELHLDRRLFVHLVPHMDALGALAGSDLDEMALHADRHPPVLQDQTILKSDSYKRL